MERLIAFLRSSVEYQDYVSHGLLSTGVLISIGTLAITLVQFWGAWKQGSTVRVKRSGDNVSPILMLYTVCFFLAFIFYGAWLKSAVVLVSGAFLSFAFIRVTVWLHRYRDFRNFEYGAGVLFTALIPAMALIGDKDAVFVAMIVGVIFAAFPQLLDARQAYRDAKPGAIDHRFFITCMIANATWFAFAFAIRNDVMKYSNPAAFAVFAAAFVYWRKAVKREKMQWQDEDFMSPPEEAALRERHFA